MVSTREVLHYNNNQHDNNQHDNNQHDNNQRDKPARQTSGMDSTTDSAINQRDDMVQFPILTSSGLVSLA